MSDTASNAPTDGGLTDAQLQDISADWECKYCARGGDTDQTLNHLKAAHPKLCRRRPRGMECSICPYVRVSDPELKGMTCEQISAKIDAGSGAGRETWYLPKVRKYEADKNEKGAGRRMNNTASVAVSTSARQSSVRQTKLLCGWLWPTKLYTQVVGGKPPKGSLETIVHNGRPVTGVIREEYRPGCYEVTDISEQAVDKTAKLASTRAGQSAEDVDAAFTSAQKRIKLTPAQMKTGNMALRTASKTDEVRAAADDSEGEEAAMDAVWGSRWHRKASAAALTEDDDDSVPKPAEGDQQPAQQKPPKKQRQGQAPKDKDQVKPTVKPQVVIEEGRSPANKGKSKDLDSAEQLGLKCSQFVTSFKAAEVVATLNQKSFEKNFQTLQESIKAKLAPESVVVYSQSDRGMKALEQIRHYEKVLPKLSGLIKSMLAVPNAPKPGTLHADAISEIGCAVDLLEGYNSACAGGVDVSRVFLDVVWERRFNELLNAKKLTDLKQLMMWQAERGVTDTQPGLASPPSLASFSLCFAAEDAARELQKRVITKTILDFCRVDDPVNSESDELKEAAAQDLRNFLSAFIEIQEGSEQDAKVPCIAVLNAAFAEEILKVWHLVNVIMLDPMMLHDEQVLSRYEHLRSELLSSKTGAAHVSLCSDPS